MVSSSHFGKCPEARVISVFSSIVYPMSPTLYFLIDEIVLTRYPSHLQSWFVVSYYCHVHKKSEFWAYHLRRMHFLGVCWFGNSHPNPAVHLSPQTKARRPPQKTPRENIKNNWQNNNICKNKTYIISIKGQTQLQIQLFPPRRCRKWLVAKLRAGRSGIRRRHLLWEALRAIHKLHARDLNPLCDCSRAVDWINCAVFIRTLYIEPLWIYIYIYINI